MTFVDLLQICSPCASPMPSPRSGVPIELPNVTGSPHYSSSPPDLLCPLESVQLSNVRSKRQNAGEYIPGYPQLPRNSEHFLLVSDSRNLYRFSEAESISAVSGAAYFLSVKSSTTLTCPFQAAKCNAVHPLSSRA